ncbi:MarR family transcriptional regulator [Catellatospora citrea]|uniref:MarR family transcriptional regulator n=2 Tax=Catellatospora citrea TaxID=53366 RepID=A0A8J3KGF0_9ACTN|nr:MarR family transcriptional regulator [Catellatospora citrea]RKE09234.1 DNA-binding MarR family transcriptional regulator [Catellatospora citrea]GIF99586.1 MarR family transcriptional regulator [Catellatospora citrea]
MVTQASPEELTERLRDAITRLNRRLRQERPVGDLTVTQLSALTSLRIGGALTPRELSEAERVQPPTMTKIVAKLEERGLISRTPHPTDGRQVLLSPSEQGLAVLEDYQRVRDEWLAGKLADLTAQERDTVARAAALLERLARD